MNRPNHLDMEGKEALAKTLEEYPGGVACWVSHDRQLISQSCNRFWLIDDSGLSECRMPMPCMRKSGTTTALKQDARR
ncbi:ABC transporter ATP-binding protein [Kluyvera cryocrescens]|uniref:ABC transporter ATP-binding protein n=1 Tax=Kluyvera cryocrescens TaxID=580 RepID=A0A485CSC9_KLUCR|nr:ABC transporter ATP-binding protein [Kluyvera cryocrescens]